MPSLDLLHFFSGNPIDKIVDEGELTIVNDGDTTSTDDWQRAKIVQDTEPNTYGKATLMRARWSIDGGSNWQGLDSWILYTFDIYDSGSYLGTFQGLDSAVSVGANNSQLLFRTANGKHGDVTNAMGSPNYTPQSRTFRIQWWLYEGE